MTDSAVKILQESLETFREKSDVPGQLQTLYQLGKVYQERRQYNKALPYFRQAFDLLKDRGKLKDRTLALANLGCVFWDMAQLKKALNHFAEALKLAEETGDKTGRRILLIIIGITHWRKGEWERAMELFEKAIRAPAGPTDDGNFSGLQEAMERGIATLKNRIRIAKEGNDPQRILLPAFSMVPLLFFAGLKNEIPGLMEEISPLAQKLQKQNILDTIPKLQKLIELD